MVLEQRLITERPLTVRPPLQFHLYETEVNPKLQLFTPIVAHDFPRFYLSGFMRPPVQQVVQVQIAHSHEISKEVGKCQKAMRGCWGASPYNRPPPRRRPRPRFERVIWSRIRAAKQRLDQAWLTTLGMSRTRMTTRTRTTVLGADDRGGL